MATCGDPILSAETCDLPWYRAFSALCAGVGSLAGMIAGAALGGLSVTVVSAALAGAGAVIGALVAYCACKLSPQRLAKISPAGDPQTGLTTATGIIIDIGRSFPIFPWGDGDYLFNIQCVNPGLINTQFDGSAACIRTKDVVQGPRYLHCEITSNVTLYGCAGAIAGAAAAAPIGVGLGIAAGAAVAAACLATGIFAPLCLAAALLIALLVSSAVTGGGALGGGAIGSAAGLAADEVNDQVGQADADVIECGDAVVFSGDWVTDRDHGWNEIHDLKRAMIIGRDFRDCDRLLKMAAAVGTGLMVAPRAGE
jgi:hypothetical protein